MVSAPEGRPGSIRVPTRPSAGENHLAASRLKIIPRNNRSSGVGACRYVLWPFAVAPVEDHGDVPGRGPRTDEERRDRGPIPHRSRPLCSIQLPTSRDGPTHGGGQGEAVLFSESGKTEEYFIIPTKSKRDLLIP